MAASVSARTAARLRLESTTSPLFRSASVAFSVPAARACSTWAVTSARVRFDAANCGLSRPGLSAKALPAAAKDRARAAMRVMRFMMGFLAGLKAVGVWSDAVYRLVRGRHSADHGTNSGNPEPLPANGKMTIS
jgi:hypothetical protein